MFSFKIATSGSELYLGGANPAKYKGAINYTPVTQQGVRRSLSRLRLLDTHINCFHSTGWSRVRLKSETRP